jgi:hypothetical protein
LPLRSEKPKPSIGYAKAARQQSQPGGLFKACANPEGGDRMMILQRFYPVAAAAGQRRTVAMHASRPYWRELVRCKKIEPHCCVGKQMPSPWDVDSITDSAAAKMRAPNTTSHKPCAPYATLPAAAPGCDFAQ